MATNHQPPASFASIPPEIDAQKTDKNKFIENSSLLGGCAGTAAARLDAAVFMGMHNHAV